MCQSTPLNAKKYVEQAKTLARQGEIQSAIEYYRKALELNPKLPIRVYQAFSNALIRQGLLEEAIELMKIAIQRYPKKSDVYAFFGDLLTQQGDAEAAIQQYRKAIELDSNQPLPVYQKLGNQLLKINQLEPAEKVFQQLSEKYPERPQGYQSLARTSLISEQFELAQQRWEKVLELFPDHIPAWVSLGNILLEQGKLEEAEAVFQELLEKYPDKPQGYESLVRLAMRSQEWELAIERLDSGISFFPDCLKFTLQKIKALQQLSLFDQAEQLLQQEKKRLPDDLQLDLAAASLYQKQFNYQAAQNILDATALKDPDNIKIQLERADNYYQLGQEQEAEKILKLIQPKIWCENQSILTRFTKLYVKVLLRNNNIDDLEKYFDEVRSNQIFNREVMINYYQLLMSKGLYQEAIQLIKGIIAADPFKIRNYQDNILLLFELEKIEQIQTLAELNFDSKFNNKLEISLKDPIESVKSNLDKCSKFETFNNRLLNIFEKVSQLSNYSSAAYLNTYTSPDEAYQVACKIINNIRNKIPLSLIRLGDGEGNFLEYKAAWQQFQEKDREKIQRTWWGCVRIDRDEWQTLKNEYFSAIQNADIIGIPEYYRFCRSFKIHLNENQQTNAFRGLITIIDTLLQPSFYQKPSHSQSVYPSLTSCHIHHDLENWGLYQIILSQINDCSLISCHEDVSQVLQEQHGVTVQKFYKIPSEYKYAQLFDYDDQKYQPHYPDYFHKICSEIKVSYQGEVFLVAAGFLGKIYCHIIKQKGGIALDIGSIADYWLNYKTRVFTQFPNQINYGSIFAKWINQDDKESQIQESSFVNHENQNQLMTAKDYANQAIILAQQGETQATIICCKKAIELNPKQPLRVYRILGDALVKQGLAEEGIEVLKKAVQKFPNQPGSYLSLANAFVKQHALEEAVKNYRKAIEINPKIQSRIQKRLDKILKKN